MVTLPTHSPLGKSSNFSEHQYFLSIKWWGCWLCGVFSKRGDNCTVSWTQQTFKNRKLLLMYWDIIAGYNGRNLTSFLLSSYFIEYWIFMNLVWGEASKNSGSITSEITSFRNLWHCTWSLIIYDIKYPKQTKQNNVLVNYLDFSVFGSQQDNLVANQCSL